MDWHSSTLAHEVNARVERQLFLAGPAQERLMEISHVHTPTQDPKPNLPGPRLRSTMVQDKI